jgi:ketosteroid isomerase-like protein
MVIGCGTASKKAPEKVPPSPSALQADETHKKVHTPPAPAEPKKILNDIFAGRTQEVLAHFSWDAIWSESGHLPVRGKEELVTHWNMLQALSPEFLPTRIIVHDRVWVAEGIFRGIQNGALPKHPPSNNPFLVHVVFVAERDAVGLIKKMSVLKNALTVPVQLGHAVGNAPAVTKVEMPVLISVDGPGKADNRVPVDAMFSAWRTGRDIPWHDVLDDSVEVHVHSDHSVILGRDAVALAFTPQLKALKPEKLEHHSLLAGDHVVVWGKNVVKQVGRLGALAATQKVASYQVVQIYQVRAGRITRADLYANPLELYEQLAPPEPVGKGMAKPEGG